MIAVSSDYDLHQKPDVLEKYLVDTSRRLQAIIDTAIDGIITINSDGAIESINQSAASLFQYEAAEIIGQNIRVLMPEPYRSEHDKYIERYQETGKAHVIGIGREVQGVKKDGTVFPFRLAVSEVQLNDRVIYTGIIHDLSEVKEAEAKLREINDSLERKVEARTLQLEEVVNQLLVTNRTLEERETALEVALDKERELNELKSRFVSMASHEFRTPLSTVLSSASIISKYTETHQQDKRIRHIEKIKSAVSNLTAILNDFLSLSKLEEQKETVVTSEVSLISLCEEVTEDVHGILKSGQTIEHRCSGPEQIIFTDHRILKNILFNLFSNAIKYSPPDSEILCKFEFMTDKVSIAVIDHGIGIPQHDQKHLFERFFRASNVEAIQGTGLGLNIVKRYLDLLEGQIDFHSTSKGSTFRIVLPYLRSADPSPTSDFVDGERPKKR